MTTHDAINGLKKMGKLFITLASLCTLVHLLWFAAYRDIGLGTRLVCMGDIASVVHDVYSLRLY